MSSTPQATSLNDLLLQVTPYHWPIIGGLCLFTIATTAIAYFLKKAHKENSANYFLCPPIFIVTLPGVFFSLIFLYMVLFSHTNIMHVSILVLFIPLWFGTTLIFYSKVIDFENIPGFDKISGLILFSGISFLVLLILLKLRIILFTWLSPAFAFFAIIALYVLWRKGLSKMFGKKKFD